MKNIILEYKKGNLTKRIDLVTKLFDNAEARILHSDTFRQRNINYALLVFAALFIIGSKTEDFSLHIIISCSLLILMIFFTIWDRRWHTTKHGWQYTRNMFREKLISLINNPEEDIEFFPYYVEGKKKAEYNSLLPILYYLLIIGSIASFFLYKFIK